MAHRKDWRQAVYAVVRLIPPGKVTTYGLIARSLGYPRSARMVGWALKAVGPGDGIPCQRVVNRTGELTGGWHFGHPDVMRAMLLEEQVPFASDYVVDLGQCLWLPSDDSRVQHIAEADQATTGLEITD